MSIPVVPHPYQYITGSFLIDVLWCLITGLIDIFIMTNDVKYISFCSLGIFPVEVTVQILCVFKLDFSIFILNFELFIYAGYKYFIRYATAIVFFCLSLWYILRAETLNLKKIYFFKKINPAFVIKLNESLINKMKKYFF